MIELIDVNKTFETKSNHVDAVKGVSLHVNKGEIFGIIGFSGAGKSTLVRCINLLEPPTSGSVRVDGLELTSLDTKELREARKKIGMIFQQFNLMRSRTVFDNVAFALKRSGLSKSEIEIKVKNLLSLVEISDKERAYPSELSGGQRQRVAIARALANDPKVLLCDEATSALDPQTTTSILKLLKSLNESIGITIVVITHEMAVVRDICDRVAVMENGKIVERGDVFDIFSKPQQKITREFIKSTSILSKIDNLIDENAKITRITDNQAILRLTYIEKNISEALITDVARKFDIDLNIIFADIDFIKDTPIGGTVVIANGDSESIKNAISYLADKNVGVEVLNGNFK